MASSLATHPANEAHLNLNLRTDISGGGGKGTEGRHRDGGDRKEEGERWKKGGKKGWWRECYAGKKVTQTSNKDGKKNKKQEWYQRDGDGSGRRIKREAVWGETKPERGRQCFYSPQSFLTAPMWCIHSLVCPPAACQNCGKSTHTQDRC